MFDVPIHLLWTVHENLLSVSVHWCRAPTERVFIHYMYTHGRRTGGIGVVRQRNRFLSTTCTHTAVERVEKSPEIIGGKSVCSEVDFCALLHCHQYRCDETTIPCLLLFQSTLPSTLGSWKVFGKGTWKE